MVVRTAPRNCCGGYMLGRVKAVLEELWVPMATPALAPFGLWVRVHIYITHDDKGHPEEHLAVVFHRAQSVLLVSQPQYFQQQPAFYPAPAQQQAFLPPPQHAMGVGAAASPGYYPSAPPKVL